MGLAGSFRIEMYRLFSECKVHATEVKLLLKRLAIILYHALPGRKAIPNCTRPQFSPTRLNSQFSAELVSPQSGGAVNQSHKLHNLLNYAY